MPRFESENSFHKPDRVGEESQDEPAKQDTATAEPFDRQSDLVFERDKRSSQADAAELDSVRRELGRNEPQLEFTNFIGFKPDSVEGLQPGIGDPMKATYLRDENGDISRFSCIEFFSAYENYALMKVVQQRFESRGITIEELHAGEAAFRISPQDLDNPDNLQKLKEALQVGASSQGEYIDTWIDLANP